MKRSTRPVVLAAPEWRDLQKKGTVAGLVRAAPLVRAADGTVSFVASSEAADRYGDTIDQAGWDLGAYQRNPVLLWAHSHDCPPVGRVGSIKVAGDLVCSGVEFTPADMHAFGAEVGAMVKAGFLNTVSVGFLPRAWEERYDEGGRFLGYHFTQCELLEISVVPVPANPEAMIEGRAFTKSLQGWASATAAGEGEPMPRAFAQQVQQLAKAADDLQTPAGDDDDADALGVHMAAQTALLERIAKATEAPRFTVRMGDFEVSGPDVASVKALLGAVTKDTQALPDEAPTDPALAQLAPAAVADAAPVGETAHEADPSLQSVLSTLTGGA